MYVHRNAEPLESDMSKLISQMTAREVRAMWIAARRHQNAVARSRGFRNYAEMAGE